MSIVRELTHSRTNMYVYTYNVGLLACVTADVVSDLPQKG